jgi:hypothetical protein
MSRIVCIAVVSFFLGATYSRADDTKKTTETMKEVAGSAEFLRGVPKHFATLKAVDTQQRRVTLLIDGDRVPKVWPILSDAEVKVAGWWGRLEQFTLGDRVWVWFKTDRKKQPVAIAMLADELSEQDMHGLGVKLAARILEGQEHKLTLKPVHGPDRVVNAAKASVYRGTEKIALEGLKAGEQLYVQSAGGQARLVLDPTAFEARRAEQKTWLRKRWADEGLPGGVAFAHTFSGELDFMLDHEAMRWGRSLKVGDKVTLAATPPISSVVKHVKPWRERTEVRLVANSFEQAELRPGQRLRLKMTPPSLEVDTAQLPPDLDRPRDKTERVEWFLASIYCSCKIGGDGCTGMFYTLASCNPNGCGMPNHVRKLIAAKIDKGMTDRQIFEEMLKEQGPDMIRPHLLP